METGISIANQFTPDINIQNREEFLKRLNEKPDTTKKQKDYAAIPDQQDGYDTIPIGVLENMLDQVYMGLWNTTKLQTQVIANEITGSIELSVYDPSAKIWITRLGLGAVTIRQKKDSALTDIGAKIKTALQMDYPKLLSMCIKNAAKSLGKKFGRDLNRKFEDYYESIYTDEISFNSVLDDVTVKLNASATVSELGALWTEYPDMHENKKFIKLFNQRKMQIQYGSNANKAA